MTALGAASPLQSWTPFFQIAGLGNLQGSRYTLPEALGLTQNIGSFTPHQQRTKIMQDIINENSEENREQNLTNYYNMRTFPQQQKEDIM